MRLLIDSSMFAALNVAVFAQWRDNAISQCHCLCPVHSKDGMFCRPGQEPMLLTLIGGLLSPRRVPMCGPCGRWWGARAPHRVAWVHAW